MAEEARSNTAADAALAVIIASPPEQQQQQQQQEEQNGFWRRVWLFARNIDGTTNLALFFIVINFFWLLRNTLLVAWDSTVFSYFQIIFNALGFFLVKKDEVSDLTTVIMLQTVQLVASSYLLYGILHKNVRCLDRWIFHHSVMGLLNALYYLYILFRSEVSLLASPLVLTLFLTSVLSYYSCNGYYMWKVYELRCSISEPTLNAVNSANSSWSRICFCSNTLCLGLAGSFSMVLYATAMLAWFVTWRTTKIVNIAGFEFWQWPTTFHFCVYSWGLISSGVMCNDNLKDRTNGIRKWMYFQVFMGMLEYGVLAHLVIASSSSSSELESMEEPFTPALIIFFLLEIPIMLLIWVAYTRVQEINEENRNHFITCYYIPGNRLITLNIGRR